MNSALITFKIQPKLQMENFTNSVLLPENLPEIDQKNFTKLNKKYRKIMLIRIAIFFLILSAGLAAYFLWRNESLKPTLIILLFSAIALLTLLMVIISLLGFPKKGYQVRENDISFQRGIITYKITTIPFNRIQHVEVNQGVLPKIFRLSALKIFTAGGNASDLSIPGLPEEVAQKLKAFLSEKISEHE